MKFFSLSDTYPCELCGRDCVGASTMAAVCDDCTADVSRNGSPEQHMVNSSAPNFLGASATPKLRRVYVAGRSASYDVPLPATEVQQEEEVLAEQQVLA